LLSPRRKGRHTNDKQADCVICCINPLFSVIARSCLMSPKASNREKQGDDSLETGGVRGSRSRPASDHFWIRWRREGRFAVGRDEELTPAAIRCSATASRLNMIERIMLLGSEQPETGAGLLGAPHRRLGVGRSSADYPAVKPRPVTPHVPKPVRPAICEKEIGDVRLAGAARGERFGLFGAPAARAGWSRARAIKST
jgi:hypothetical protein